MYKDILLPIDLQEADSWKSSLPVAIEYASAFGAVLHIMTVVPSFGMNVVGSFFPDDFAEKAIAEVDKQLHAFVSSMVPDNVKVQHVVEHGRIYEEIIQTADKLNVDLIVMAAHRPDVRDYLLGTNAARVARHSSKSVLIVR